MHYKIVIPSGAPPAQTVGTPARVGGLVGKVSVTPAAMFSGVWIQTAGARSTCNVLREVDSGGGRTVLHMPPNLGAKCWHPPFLVYPLWLKVVVLQCFCAWGCVSGQCHKSLNFYRFVVRKCSKKGPWGHQMGTKRLQNEAPGGPWGAPGGSWGLSGT